MPDRLAGGESLVSRLNLASRLDRKRQIARPAERRTRAAHKKARRKSFGQERKERILKQRTIRERERESPQKSKQKLTFLIDSKHRNTFSVKDIEQLKVSCRCVNYRALNGRRDSLLESG